MNECMYELIHKLKSVCRYLISRIVSESKIRNKERDEENDIRRESNNRKEFDMYWVPQKLTQIYTVIG